MVPEGLFPWSHQLWATCWWEIEVLLQCLGEIRFSMVFFYFTFWVYYPFNINAFYSSKPPGGLWSWGYGISYRHACVRVITEESSLSSLQSQRSGERFYVSIVTGTKKDGFFSPVLRFTSHQCGSGVPQIQNGSSQGAQTNAPSRGFYDFIGFKGWLLPRTRLFNLNLSFSSGEGQLLSFFCFTLWSLVCSIGVYKDVEADYTLPSGSRCSSHGISGRYYYFGSLPRRISSCNSGSGISPQVNWLAYQLREVLTGTVNFDRILGLLTP